MTEQDVSELIGLVQAYRDAYFERMQPEARIKWPYLWADRPLRQEYDAVLAFVQELDVSRLRYSEKTIESFVDDLLTEVLQDGARVEREALELAAILNHELVTRLYIPLDGIASDAPIYDVGALRLVSMDDEAFERLIMMPYADVMRTNPHYDEASKDRFIEMHRRELLSLNGRVCAEISTNLDIPRTFAFADDVVIGALCDFLQFAASIFVAHNKKLKIAWAGDGGVAWRHAFAQSNDPRKHSNRHNERVSGAHPFSISADRVAKIVDLGLDRIADLVGRKAPTEYDELLQRAVRWFAKGEREEHPDDRKLSYVTVADLFFSEVGPGATKRICDGFAFALARDLDAVPRLARYMFQIFSSRSATSHAGELGVMDEEALSALRWHVQNFVIAMARMAFVSKGDVAAWLATQRDSLTVAQRTALNGATDWKTVEIHDDLIAIASTLRHLVNAGLLGRAETAKAKTLALVLRNAGRDGGKPITDLRPLLLALDQDHDALVAKIQSETVTQADAIAYLKLVTKRLSRLKWLREALKS